MEHVIGGKFKLGRKIGSGSFGELYLGMHSVRPFSFGAIVIVLVPLLALVQFFLNFWLCFLGA